MNIIAICVAIWACSTALCATAGSFSEQLVWRAGTAIAEAALSLDYIAYRQVAAAANEPERMFLVNPR
nr:hypothetical protein [Pseudomonas arsenicoxydans]